MPKASEPSAKTTAGNDQAASPLSKLDAISTAVEAGTGLTAVTRAAAAALESSLAVIDSRSAVLAVAAASPEDERRLLAGEGGTVIQELKVAEKAVGSLRVRSRRSEGFDAVTLRMVATLIALEVERTLAPERADQMVASGFIGDLINGVTKDAADVTARAEELGIEVERGCAFVLARATPRKAVGDDWRARLLLVVERVARSLHPRVVTAQVERPGSQAGEVYVLLPSSEPESVAKAANTIREELEATLGEFNFTVGHGRITSEPADLYRAGQEALLAVNVAEANGAGNLLSFEDTGAYRLLLPALCDDPAELHRFYAETIEPLVSYDDQYETNLVHTVDTFLAADGNVAGTAQRLFTHRHTIRYRLERVKDLTGLDCSSTDGRERLSLGLKSMRVLGIANPGGPAYEPGVEGGRIPAAG
ncbi:MAG: helix-turn-helix domain-containing protein [Thermoleophilaceae bacterium]|nr:helix-turn-helix domain-containing protein [Thermoleophilaceae bacterium]